MTRETVIADTPPRRATSWMVGIAFFCLRAAGRFRARPVFDFMASLVASTSSRGEYACPETVAVYDLISITDRARETQAAWLRLLRDSRPRLAVACHTGE